MTVPRSPVLGSIWLVTSSPARVPSVLLAIMCSLPLCLTSYFNFETKAEQEKDNMQIELQAAIHT